MPITAHLHAEEDIWPHYPTGDCDMVAKAYPPSGGNVVFAVKADATGVPSLVLLSCSAQVQSSTQFNACTSTGLDILLNLFESNINQVVTYAMQTGICDAAKGIAKQLSLILASFAFTFPLPFPTPFNEAILDFHLTENPYILPATDAPSYYYLENPQTAEVYPSNSATRFAGSAPGVVKLAQADLSGRMVLAVMTPYPFDSALWTFFVQGALQTVFNQSDLGGLGYLLNTNFYVKLLPLLTQQYPNQSMTVLFNVTSSPTLEMLSSGQALRFNLTLAFYVGDFATNPNAPLAFTLWSDFKDEATFSSDGVLLYASLLKAELNLQPGFSPFGNETAALITNVQAPLLTIINSGIIPKLNAILGKGVSLPSFGGVVNRFGIASVNASLVNALVDEIDGAVIFGADCKLVITHTHTCADMWVGEMVGALLADSINRNSTGISPQFA